MASHNEPSRGGIVVIGLGRFGTSLALELVHEGIEVLGIDEDAKVVQSLAGRLTHVVQADSTDAEAMRQLSVDQFSHGVIGIGNNLECSILSASTLLDLGLANVWAKAISDPHARILSQIGVHHVVRPEHDMGTRVAHLVRGKMLDYIELDDGYAVVKTDAPAFLHDVPISQSQPRARYGVNVVGVKRPRQEFSHATSDTVIRRGDLIVVAGPYLKVERFSNLE